MKRVFVVVRILDARKSMIALPHFETDIIAVKMHCARSSRNL